MAASNEFLTEINNGYDFKGEHFKIGCGMLNGELVTGADVFIPLRMLNRHGLIAGATGTGKTKTLQMISEAPAVMQACLMLVLDIKRRPKRTLGGRGGTVNDKITSPL